MRSSSSAHRAACAFLSALCLFEWIVAAFPSRADDAETVLLLKYSSPAIADEAARRRFDAITAEIEGKLNVRPATASRTRGDGLVLPEIDDATLESISSRISEAGRKLDRLETRDAERQLAAIETDLRRYRIGDATRPLLGDVFLKLATLSLWDDDAGKAASFLAKAHALRPGFEPDPALYPPRFRELWAGLGHDPSPEADILVESVPPGARILVNGQERGTTPRRLKLPAPQPVELRLEHPGYRPSMSTRQWLPGDSERIEVLLAGDREARLAAFLEGTAARVPEAAPIVAEMTGESGAGKVAFFLLDRKSGGEEIRVLAASSSDPVPRALGTIRLADGNDGVGATGSASRLLAADGWPVRKGDAGPEPGRPWYYRWWFLTGVSLLAAGTAVALSGGGGDGGGSSTSTSSSDVKF